MHTIALAYQFFVFAIPKWPVIVTFTPSILLSLPENTFTDRILIKMNSNCANVNFSYRHLPHINSNLWAWIQSGKNTSAYTKGLTRLSIIKNCRQMKFHIVSLLPLSRCSSYSTYIRTLQLQLYTTEIQASNSFLFTHSLPFCIFAP